jgi:hypothetical protein
MLRGALAVAAAAEAEQEGERFWVGSGRFVLEKNPWVEMGNRPKYGLQGLGLS